MPPKSLVALCLGTILKNISLVSGIGDELPYDNPHVQKILSKIASATQLREMETNSPQLQGHTGKFWKEIIHREFPNSRKKNYVPSDPAGWWKVYKRHKKEHEESLEAATAALRNAFDGIAASDGKNRSLVLERSQLPKPTRTGRAIGARRRGQRPATGSSSLTFTAGSRTKLVSGKNVLRRARREAMDIAVQRGSLATVSRAGGTGTSQLRAAPLSLLERNRVAAQPALRTSSGLASSLPAPVSRPRPARVDQRRHDEPEPIIVDVDMSDMGDSDSLFGDSDEDEPPAKKARRDSRQPRDLPRGSNDRDRAPKAKAAAPMANASKAVAIDSAEHEPPKRKKSALLPGKPGAGRFLKPSSNPSSSGKSTALHRPPRAPTTSTTQSSTSATGAAAKVTSGPAGRAYSPPQAKPAASSPPPPPAAMLPRKRKVDIFMKPRKRT